MPALVAACTDRWYNQTLCRANDAVVRLGILEGEYHWHRHEEEDEFFFTLDGCLLLDIEGRDTMELGPRQGVVVPRGVMHRTRAPEKVVILMMETAAIDPIGEKGASRVQEQEDIRPASRVEPVEGGQGRRP